MWYLDFAWKMPLNGKKNFRGCAPDPLTPGQVRGARGGLPCGCMAPTTTDDAARAEHKCLSDAQVLKRMTGVKEKSQFLSQATPPS